MDEARVAERAADTFAGFLERGIGQPDDRESRQPGRDVDLDPDQPASRPWSVADGTMANTGQPTSGR